jgi:hypothetical protein
MPFVGESMKTGKRDRERGEGLESIVIIAGRE